MVYGRLFVCERVVTPAQEEAAENAPLQKRVAALKAAAVDKQRVADARALVQALKELLAA